jgi:hypothetical protein
MLCVQAHKCKTHNFNSLHNKRQQVARICLEQHKPNTALILAHLTHKMLNQVDLLVGLLALVWGWLDYPVLAAQWFKALAVFSVKGTSWKILILKTN